VWAVTTDCVPDATATLAVDSVAGGATHHEAHFTWLSWHEPRKTRERQRLDTSTFLDAHNPKRHNAAQSTPRMGQIAPAFPDPMFDTEPARARCPQSDPITLLHNGTRHQVHISTQTQPLHAPPAQARPKQHLDGSARAKSPQHPSPHRPPR